MKRLFGFTLDDKKKKCFISLWSKKPGCDPAKPRIEDGICFNTCFLFHRLCHKTKCPETAPTHSPQVRRMIQIRPSPNQGSSGSPENMVSKWKPLDFYSLLSAGATVSYMFALSCISGQNKAYHHHNFNLEQTLEACSNSKGSATAILCLSKEWVPPRLPGDIRYTDHNCCTNSTQEGRQCHGLGNINKAISKQED